MALSISTTNSIKPMAISSITSPPSRNSSLVSSPFYHNRHSSSPHRQSYYPSTAPSPPESPTYRIMSSHRQPHYSHHQRHSISSYNPSHYLTSDNNDQYNNRNASSDGNLQRASSLSSLQAPPLSLQERRQRNKAASAKYRAKKNQQHGEMRSHILSLTKDNDLLQRQLDHARGENNRLKVTCDRLRGKMLAEKMLKKLLDDKEELESIIDDEDIGLAEDCSPLQKNNVLFKEEHHATMLQRFDEDIDFDDEDGEESQNNNDSEYQV